MKWKSWRVTRGWKGTFKIPSKISTEENESSSKKRSQAAITTACCSDGGDKGRCGANTKPALWTSAHPIFLHFEPRALVQRTLNPFKGVSHRSDKGHVQESGWEVQNAIRSLHLMVIVLVLFVVFYCLFHFIRFVSVFGGRDSLEEVFF